jgi:acyl-CoA synthetase (AMP-forming)/AMP-acid ligase II
MRRVSWPSELRYFVSAAAPLARRTARAVHERLGIRVIQGYGLSETTNFSTTMPTNLAGEAYQRLMLDADIPSIGVALYGNEVEVHRPDGSTARPGEAGEICMRGLNVMRGYAGNDVATTEAFRGGWFHSGDLGSYVDDADTGGRFFMITGRAKNIAKVAGAAVSLDEMDRVLSGLSGVIDAACVAVPHPLLGEEVIAAIVCRQPVEERDVRAYLRGTFAAAVLPRRIVRVERIARTPTGKLKRAELAELLMTGEPPGTPARLGS